LNSCGEWGYGTAPLELAPKWFQFAKHYAAVISQAPLVFEPSLSALNKATAAGHHPLRHVDKISATAYLPSEAELSRFHAIYPAGEYFFRIEWQFWKDGKETDVKFSHFGAFIDYDKLHDPSRPLPYDCEGR
jgi:long-subunit fatty acid transport protein